jgi:hypothetical protein
LGWVFTRRRLEVPGLAPLESRTGGRRRQERRDGGAEAEEARRGRVGHAVLLLNSSPRSPLSNLASRSFARKRDDAEEFDLSGAGVLAQGRAEEVAQPPEQGPGVRRRRGRRRQRR